MRSLATFSPICRFALSPDRTHLRDPIALIDDTSRLYCPVRPASLPVSRAVPLKSPSAPTVSKRNNGIATNGVDHDVLSRSLRFSSFPYGHNLHSTGTYNLDSLDLGRISPCTPRRRETACHPGTSYYTHPTTKPHVQIHHQSPINDILYTATDHANEISLLTALVAGAALVEVGTSPIRVVVIASSSVPADVASHMRFGNTIPYNNANATIATLVKSVGLDGKVLRLALIKTGSASVSVSSRPSYHCEHTAQILPFIGTPLTLVEPKNVDANLTEPHQYVAHAHAHPRLHHIVYIEGRLMKHPERVPFLKRIYFPLMESLGPWEGRAIALVLSWGIGVLLRMFWVFAVISYRLIKGHLRGQSLTICR
ncbi:hypothetical protein Hypma_015250 [Hypsizygus marmoreus]|uniref:Uncharacterized protein n=1 Tax=Hypsizygus marmoreus TaxID=39966 RepID=A0A369K2L0_HYPMA|nr:hypothetical protein Hypma_015250 [Hypsizygus marmoreus]